MAGDEILHVELAYFQQRRGHLLAEHHGKYALVKGKKLVGTFDTHEAAYENGVNRFGNVPFLIKEIREHDEVVRLPALSLGLLRAHL